MPPYVSPKDLRGLRQDFIPDGDFILPICTNRERFFLILQALQYFRSRSADHQNLDHLIDFLEGWAYLGNPQESPCFPQFTTGDGKEICVDYPTNATIITYAPQNPFTQPDYIPDGYIAVPFLEVKAGTPLAALGFQIGDILTGYLSLPLLTPALNQGLARFRVDFDGTGTIEVHLIKIPSGGMAVITHDDNPLTAQTVVLNKDLVQLPPETNGEAIIEIPFDTPGHHHVDVSFIARLNDELTFLTYGGGLRKIVLCGFNATLDLEVQNRQGKGKVEVNDSVGTSIRTDPANCHMLQFECKPGEWENLLDTRCGAIAQATQPTNGEPLSPGQCREWDVVLRGNERWLLPVTVSEGDTIQISAPQGAWNDGTLQWFCPDGSIFFANTCSGADAAAEDDPAQTLYHMRMIMNVGVAVVDAYNAFYAVAAGVSDAVVQFQANDGTLSDNSGSISFHLKVCSQSVPEEPIGVTYGFGAGISSILSGQVFTVLSGCCGGGGGSDTGMKIQFSEDVKVEILGQSGFVLTCPDNCGWMHSSNASDTPIVTILRDDTTSPLDWPATEVLRNLYIESVTAGVEFTITLRVTRA